MWLSDKRGIYCLARDFCYHMLSQMLGTVPFGMRDIENGETEDGRGGYPGGGDGVSRLGPTYISCAQGVPGCAWVSLI